MKNIKFLVLWSLALLLTLSSSFAGGGCCPGDSEKKDGAEQTEEKAD